MRSTFLIIWILILQIKISISQTIVINEIAWMGTAASYSDEWIELYNLTPDSIDLADWTLKSADGTPTITLLGRIPGHGYFVLERTDDHTLLDYPAQQIYTGDLGNTGEHLLLEDSSHFKMDEVDCSAGWFAGQNSPVKYTMEKKHPWAASSSAESWQNNSGLIFNGLDANANAINGTPGAQNSVYTPTEVFNTNIAPNEKFSLYNSPNPFNPATTIYWTSLNGAPAVVSMIIYDQLGRIILGRREETLQSSVPCRFIWDGRDQQGRPIPSGVYYCRLWSQSGQVYSLRMVKVQ